MKNILYHIALVTALLMLPGISKAQMMLGPKIGMNIAGQSNVEFPVLKLDYAFGAALQLQINDQFKVQGEFLVTRKGNRETVIVNDGSEIVRGLTATYLEIPAMIKYTHLGVNWGFFAATGAYWSYWTKKEYEEILDGEFKKKEGEFYKNFANDPYRDIRSDFGGVIEAGVTYDNFGSGILALGVRYSHGFRPIGEYETPSPDFVERKNQVLTISLTYFLFL